MHYATCIMHSAYSTHYVLLKFNGKDKHYTHRITYMKNSDVLYKKSKKFRDLIDRIHDTIDEETNYENDKNHIAASNAGLKAWSYLKELMKILDAKSFCDLERETIYDLLYWACALTGNLYNASRKDESFLQKKFLFCKEHVELHQDFLSKDMRNIGNIRRSLADCYVDIRDVKTCDSLYETWLQKESDWGWGWLGWSDCYWLFQRKNKPDLKKATSILERGLAIKEVDDKNHMTDRLNSLKKEMLTQSC